MLSRWRLGSPAAQRGRSYCPGACPDKPSNGLFLNWSRPLVRVTRMGQALPVGARSRQRGQLAQVLIEVPALGSGVVDRPAEHPLLVDDVRRAARGSGALLEDVVGAA